MAEAFFTANPQIPDEEKDVLKTVPSSSWEGSNLLIPNEDIEVGKCFPSSRLEEGTLLITSEGNEVNLSSSSNWEEGNLPSPRDGREVVQHSPSSWEASNLPTSSEAVEFKYIPSSSCEKSSHPVSSDERAVKRSSSSDSEESDSSLSSQERKAIKRFPPSSWEERNLPSSSEGKVILKHCPSSSWGGSNLPVPIKKREVVKVSLSSNLDGYSYPVPNEERVFGNNALSISSDNIKVEDEEDSGSDIIIEDELVTSRSSSPEVEVVKVFKSATQFTVDLTKDDDNDDDSLEICESIGQSQPTRTDEFDTPALDLNSEDDGFNQPLLMPQDPGSFGSTPLNLNNLSHTHSHVLQQPSTDFSIESDTSRPVSQGVLVTQDDDDTLSLLRDLEAHASLPKRLSPILEHFDLTRTINEPSVPNDRKQSGHSSGELSTGSTSNGNRLEARRSVQLVNPFSDSPLDMRMSSGLSFKSVTRTINDYGGFSFGMPLHGNTSTNHASSSSSVSYNEVSINSVDSSLQKTVMASTDYKSPVLTHPNSAFQAVTPSTSGSRVPDPLDFIADYQSKSNRSASFNSSSGIDGTVGNHASSSQSWHSCISGLSGSYGNSLLYLPNNNSKVASGTAHPSFGASPSTSSENYNQTFGSGSSHQSEYGMSTDLPVLSPSTVLEQVSVGTPGIINSDMQSTSKASSHTSVPQAAGKAKVLEMPPSPEGPTFSCSICLDSLKTIQNSDRNLCSTVCGHVFCSECLQESLKKKKECPICRKKLGKKQYHPLFLS